MNSTYIQNNLLISGVFSHGKNNEPVGEPLKSVVNAPKVKLEISSGPAPPILNFPALPYGRRKKKGWGDDENAPKRVKLIISAKRLHPATKSNNILLEPLSEIQVSPPIYKRKLFRICNLF